MTHKPDTRDVARIEVEVSPNGHFLISTNFNPGLDRQSPAESLAMQGIQAMVQAIAEGKKPTVTPVLH